MWISYELVRGDAEETLIYWFFFSVDVLAFATEWSIKPVPGLNNVAVEGVQSGSSQKQETQMNFNLTLVSTFQH